MQTKRLEKWIWILIYGGLIGFSLGWFLESSSAATGWTLMVVGTVVVVVGAVLIFVRSRMGP